MTLQRTHATVPEPQAVECLNTSSGAAPGHQVAAVDPQDGGELLAQLPGQVAVVAGDGRILAVNNGWRRFAADNGLAADISADFNYLQVCAVAQGPDAALAGAALVGIRDVLHGVEAEFDLQYPCHSPDHQRWFRLRATPLRWQGARAALVMHSDVSAEVIANDRGDTADEQLRDAELLGQFGTFRARKGSAWTIELSPGLRSLLGIDDATVAGNVWAALRRLGLRHLVEDVRRAMEASGAFHGSLVYTLGAGSRQLEIHAHQVATPGRNGVILGFVRDVTGQQLALRAQAQSRVVLRIAGSSIGAWSYDGKTGGFIVSSGLRRALKLPAVPVLRSAQVLRWIVTHHRGLVIGAFRAALQEGKPFQVEVEFQGRPRTQPVWVRIGGEAVAGAGVQGALQITRDRGRLEQSLAEKKRTLDLLSRCHDVLVRATEERRLLDDLCAAIVATGNYPGAWIADRGPLDGALRSLAGAGVPEGLLTPEFLAWPAGAIRAALRGGRLQFVPSLRTNSRYARWAPGHVERGIEGLVAVPLSDRDEVHAVLVLYLGHAGSLSQRELEALAALGRDIGHGIGSLRTRDERAVALRAMVLQAELLDKAHDAIIVRGIGGQVLYWNNGASRLYGWPADEVMGANLDELVFAGTPGFADVMRQVEAQGDLACELDVRHRDGRALCVQSTWTLMRDEDGAPTSMLAICTDTTVRRQIADELAHSRRLLETAQAVARLATVEIDHAHGTITSTKGTETILGLARPPRTVHDLSRRLAAASRLALQSWLQPGREGETFDLDLKLREGPVVRWVRAVGSRANAPQRRSTTIVFQDVTEVRQAREEVLRSNADLERKVQHRTRQLETANQDLEAFSYSVSHDLKTPLAAIEGFTHVLAARLRGRLDEKETSYMERVRAGVASMYGLIDAMLALHTATHGRPLKWETVDLSSIAETLVAELREQDPARACSIRIEPGIAAQCDRELMTAVLRNLIGNAWKFSARKAVTVIEVARESHGGTDVTFHVRDEGEGFAQDLAANLFTPFRRLHSSSDFPGTGIGLATVQRIVSRHGGTIRAKGEPGVGATFSISLALDRSSIAGDADD